MKLIPVACLLAFCSAPLFAEETDKREALFELRCGTGCHQLPEPSMLKATQWQRVMKTMETRMAQAGMPALNDEERTQLLDYLSEHARQ